MELAASGYHSLRGTPLDRIGYHDRIIARAFERDFLPDITNHEITERIFQCNQVVQFVRQPKVGGWRRYETNQVLQHDQITPEGFTMVVDQQFYKSLKFDKTDIRHACERWSEWEDSFLDSTYQSLVGMWRSYVLSAMTIETSPLNKGNSAGLRGNIQLGQTGAPMMVTPNNIPKMLTRLYQVLRDAQRWVEGEMFIVIPTAMKEILAMSPYVRNDWLGACGDCSILIDGKYPNKLMGFDVYETTYLPSAIDPTGELAYYVVAGHKDAFAFAADIVDSELIDKDKDSFGVFYNMLSVMGGKAIYNDALAVGYWTLGE